jgi:hypothetical protein
MMHKTAFFILPFAMALAACDDGDGDFDFEPDRPPVTEPDEATLLSVFRDGSGVAQTKVTVDGQVYTGVALVQNVQAYVRDFALLPNFAEGGLSNEVEAGSNAYGTFYTATADINGTPIDLVFYQSDAGDLQFTIADDGLNLDFDANGPRVSNIPSGTYTYVGTNALVARNGSGAEDGTFTMTVDFDRRVAAINASTPSSSLSGSGIAVNTSNGTLSGSNLDLSVDGASSKATINGNFHGDGATGVTGIYHDNAPNPSVAGLIAGTR